MGFHVLVLAGGSGTRLWPLSRGRQPKHLLPLAPGGRSLLAATVDRVTPIADQVHVVTAQAQAAQCAEELERSGSAANVIAEPEARGTGPALGLAVATILRSDPDAVISSVHADHRVADDDAYRAAVLAAAGWARTTGGLATVGLTPASPATGFGYIELGGRPGATWRDPGGPAAGALLDAARALPAAEAAGFVEKPPRERAEAFVAGGNHLWNLGLFAWSGATFMRELSAADAALAAAVQETAALREAGDDEGAARLYGATRSVAVEPLVLEGGAPLVAVRAGFGWSDLGAWSDLIEARRDAGEADADGNVVSGSAITLGARGTTVEARGGRLVVAVGTQELVVVDTPDAVLVMPASDSQRVKEVVDRLRAEGRSDLL